MQAKNNEMNTQTSEKGNGQKALWDKILKVVIALLSAIAGALGAQAMNL